MDGLFKNQASAKRREGFQKKGKGVNSRKGPGENSRYGV